MSNTTSFQVGEHFGPGDKIEVHARHADVQPAFDSGEAITTVTRNDDGTIDVPGKPGDELFLFQKTGEDSFGRPLGSQVAITIPDTGERKVAPSKPAEASAKPRARKTKAKAPAKATTATSKPHTGPRSTTSATVK